MFHFAPKPNGAQTPSPNANWTSAGMGYKCNGGCSIKHVEFTTGDTAATAAGDLTMRFAYISGVSASVYSTGGGTQLGTLTLTATGAEAARYYRGNSADVDWAVPANSTVFSEVSAVNFWTGNDILIEVNAEET